MLPFIEKAKEVLRRAEQSYSAIQVAPPDTSFGTNGVSPTLCEIEDYLTQETDVDPSQLRCRIEDLTNSCRSTMGNGTDLLTTIVLDDLFKLLRTGILYSQMVARMDELEQMGAALENQIAEACKYERRLEAVRAARIELERSLLDKPMEGDEYFSLPPITVDAAEATSSQHNDRAVNLVPRTLPTTMSSPCSYEPAVYTSEDQCEANPREHR